MKEGASRSLIVFSMVFSTSRCFPHSCDELCVCVCVCVCVCARARVP
jgi:hypothetical protein